MNILLKVYCFKMLFMRFLSDIYQSKSKQMKKILSFSILAMFIFSLGISDAAAQKRKDRKKLWASDYNYEAQCIGTGVEGTKLIKVWGFAKKAEDAIVKAKKDAVAACIFRGVPGVDKVDPIITSPSEADKHEAFFDSFFETGGRYLQYISVTNDASGKDRIKLNKGYKVGVVVSVMYDALRKYLEEQGIVEELGGAISSGKKPSIMIVPSGAFCNAHGYTQEWDNQGSKTVIPDYDKALLESQDLRLVLRKIEGMMADRGFPLKNLEASLKKIKESTAKKNMLMSKESGLTVAESPLDVLNRTAKADIIMDLDYKVVKKGPKQYVTFNLGGLDAYTSKAVATAAGTGVPSFTAAPELLLEEAVLKHLDNFNTQLQDYFEDMAENGREVTLQVMVWDGAGFDLESEYDYRGRTGQLNQILNMWMAKNTIDKKYNRLASTENQLTFENARIPLEYYDEWVEDNVPMDTEAFAMQLRSFLKQNFDIESKVVPQGLGEAWLVLGEK